MVFITGNCMDCQFYKGLDRQLLLKINLKSVTDQSQKQSETAKITFKKVLTNLKKKNNTQVYFFIYLSCCL